MKFLLILSNSIPISIKSLLRFLRLQSWNPLLLLYVQNQNNLFVFWDLFLFLVPFLFHPTQIFDYREFIRFFMLFFRTNFILHWARNLKKMRVEQSSPLQSTYLSFFFIHFLLGVNNRNHYPFNFQIFFVHPWKTILWISYTAFVQPGNSVDPGKDERGWE